MDHNNEGHGEHGEIHLPDPSIWPLVVGVAAFLLGAALIYWTENRDSDFSGPFLGAALIATLISGCGWAYEDGRMKRKAEEGAHSKQRDARFTQVVTFAVPEGVYATARTAGILSELEASDSALRDLDGFQDMRIIAAPAEAGPSQVLLETTWANREGLASYEQTRKTILDAVAAHPDEVVPGSVQVFDMEVIRDTKDTSFNFGTGAAVAMFGSLIVGGFMVGAGLNMFASESEGTGGGEPPPAANPFEVTMRDSFFVPDTLRAAPAIEVTFTAVNRGQQIHNIHFLTAKGGDVIADGDNGTAGERVDGGATGTITFTTPGVGSYYFFCVFHPDVMDGTFIVEEGGPGSAAPPAAEGAATATP